MVEDNEEKDAQEGAEDDNKDEPGPLTLQNIYGTQSLRSCLTTLQGNHHANPLHFNHIPLLSASFILACRRDHVLSSVSRTFSRKHLPQVLAHFLSF